MELWVRSQDKEVLMNVNHLYLSNNGIVGFCQSTFTSPILGTYKTKERALEVLDEINEVKFYKYMASLGWSSFVSGVLEKEPMEKQKLILSMMDTYQMPEE